MYWQLKPHSLFVNVSKISEQNIAAGNSHLLFLLTESDYGS